MKYGYCLNHPQTYAINAKKLCGVCTKARHEKSAESKGLTVKKKDDGGQQRNGIHKSIRSFPKLNGSYRKPQLDLEVQKQVTKKKTKINPISKDKAAEISLLGAIKKQKIEVQGKVCEMCGNNGEVDLFHIIGVGDKKHSTNPINTLLACRQCHDIWGANDWLKIVKFKNFD